MLKRFYKILFISLSLTLTGCAEMVALEVASIVVEQAVTAAASLKQEKKNAYKPDLPACSLSNLYAPMTKCSDDFICSRAVDSGVWYKSSHLFYGYVTEAKKRGLSCGVVSSSATPKVATCSTNTNKCNDTELCGRASYFTGTKSLWFMAKYSQRYVLEAKKRGLSCGVASSSSTTKTPSVCSFKNPNACSSDLVCQRGSRLFKGKRIWDERSTWIKYSVEAKKRGLSCGVASSSSTPSIETKVPKVVPSVVPKKKPQIPTKSSPSLIDPLHVTKYGKTYHTALLPKVIFFIGEIEDGDEQGFRRALRSHDVDTVVLLSGGGLTYNGLELANIIFDNNLTTYIPAGKLCASACSYMFFAGNPKVAHGRLGVHQFYVEDDKKKVEIGKVQKGTQLLVADIIRNLTDFGTPPSVFSKMFSTSGMYFFSEEEKRSFSDSNKISPETVARINEVLSYFIKDIDDELNDVVLNGMPQEVKSRLIQLELLRIGCMQGPVDGIKGEATTAAIQLLSSKKGSNLSALKFSDLFRSLNNTKQEACY